MTFTSNSTVSIDSHLAGIANGARAGTSVRDPDSLLACLPWTISPEQMLHANLLSVFWLGDPAGILGAIWHEMPVIYEEHGASAGQDAVSRAAERFRRAVGSATCQPIGPVIGHSGLYMLRWQARHDDAYVASGCHLANLRKGRIESLYSVID